MAEYYWQAERVRYLHTRCKRIRQRRVVVKFLDHFFAPYIKGQCEITHPSGDFRYRIRIEGYSFGVDLALYGPVRVLKRRGRKWRIPPVSNTSFSYIAPQELIINCANLYHWTKDSEGKMTLQMFEDDNEQVVLYPSNHPELLDGVYFN